MLINDTKLQSRECLQALHDLHFTILSWDKEMKDRNALIETQWKVTKDKKPKNNAEIEEKEKRTELLFRVVGTKETLKPKIKVELWGMEFKMEEQEISKDMKVGEFRHYVLTYDNILKMIAIYLRIQSDTPVILMGETGCGKTSLIKCLAKVASVPLQAIDVHSGFGRQELRNMIQKCLQKCKEAEQRGESKIEQWIFLDEINTSPDIGWFNELVCNRTVDGVQIAREIKIIAACNPYRKRKLSVEEDEFFANDELRNYVYRVHPLCETMKEYVWPFGRLSELDEQQYIVEMINQAKGEIQKTFHDQFEEWKPKIAAKITCAQKFLRERLQDRAIVSLRDVSRCLKIFSWLLSKYLLELNVQKDNPWLYRSLNIAIGLCYFFRLGKEREELSKRLQDKGASKKNLFILFMCITTATPIVMVGKPGTSKTLSFQIIRDNLSHGKTEFEKKLKENHIFLPVKSIHTISFQCTRDSKPQAIEERWDQAMRHSENDQLKTILLLDEIGLAEHSKHSPLKILHPLLEDPKISFVGISNWPLDAAKMNRVIMHQIPAMTMKELELTAAKMVEHYKEKVINISKVYNQVVNHKSKLFEPMQKKNFFGARDFFSLIRYQLQSPSYKNSLAGFMRNFGGIPRDDLIQNLSDIFKDCLGMDKGESVNKMSTFTPMDCIQLNLSDTQTNSSKLFGDNYIVSRHCMVISELDHSWQVLLENGILRYDDVFLFKSSFAHDECSSISDYEHLNKVISCMDTGKRVILYNLESIYESLYDMLNQRYQKKPSGKNYLKKNLYLCIRVYVYVECDLLKYS
ncbi:hypothetical protein RFI_30799 [Reticulomyxa filosa]|uniref:AAA+ ATPase domain-containing protein n=1 Tax=Reticulomyxa filosa TaxID=46433 RepID=X6LZ05_RETFI|nr:hypothetical protein RFI_30799 [Reticulomyxa filosa]|eukprot:ETO06596.1 hypothetical protein RFI_30799 [Reticulomyxa filosa]